MACIWFHTSPEAGDGQIAIKIEINVRETIPHRSYVLLPHRVQSRWWGWWTMPDGRSLAGELTFSNEDGAVLRAYGSREQTMRPGMPWMVALHGQTVDGKDITLLEATLRHHQDYLFGGHDDLPTSQVWHANTVIVGAHVDSEEDLKFQQCTFRLSGLTEWLTEPWNGPSLFELPPAPFRRGRRRRRYQRTRTRQARSRSTPVAWRRRAMLAARARAMTAYRNYRQTREIWSSCSRRHTRRTYSAASEPVLYLTAAMTGLRQGELLGLRWRDVDFAARKVCVVSPYVRGEFGDPKSEGSGRSVPLAERVATELEALRARSPYATDKNLVFCHPETGNPLDRAKLTRRFKKAVRGAGVREITFHELRHTFGTRMAGAGVPLRTLQHWMGYADAKTTQVYAHYQPSDHEADTVDRAFSGERRTSQ
jgi:integrase